MESGQTEIQQNPNPPPPGQNPNQLSAGSYSSHFQYYPAQKPSLNPNPVVALQPHDPLYVNPPVESSVGPPGVDPHSAYPNAHYSYATASDSTVYQQPVASVGYYSGADLQNWVARETVRQFGLDPALYGVAAAPVTGLSAPQIGTEQLLTANLTSTLWTYPTIQPNGSTNLKKPPKKTKVVQSAYCGICKVDCNSKDMLEKHKLGKKHKKNVEKLQQSLVPVPARAPPPPTQTYALPASSNPVIGPQENPNKGKIAGSQKGKKKASATPVDLETKKRKVLEGGASVEAVRTCQICNVVCNSDTVFNYHIVGQKHASMVKKLLARRT